MQKILNLKTYDNYTIYGVLNSGKIKKDKIIIFVHGLYSSKDDNLYINASNYFYSNNFDNFRFDLYSKNKNARKLSDSNITFNSKDLETVIKYFQNEYKEIYLIGHSLGGQAIINTDKSKISKIVLWDPSSGLSKQEEENDISYDKEKGVYIVNRGVKFSISKELKKEWSNATNISKYIKNITNNTSFIFAGKSSIYKNWEKYIKNCKKTIIKGADHTFSGKLSEKYLYEKTLKFLTY